MPTLEWIGKEKVINHHQQVPYRVLEEQYTYNAERSENMIIRGDNLEALKALMPRYEGRIKCIYIDPPYNTAKSTNENQRWVYNDNVDDPKIKKWLGEVVGDEGEDLSRHDKWLCMMYPRLKLLHKLLAKDGVIFISIDDNEQDKLKILCNEIFGSLNFIAQLVWEKKKKGSFLSGTITNIKEYVFVYCKNKDCFEGLIGSVEYEEETYPCINAPNKRELRNIKGGILSKYREKSFVLPAGTIISNKTMSIEYKTNLVVEDGVVVNDFEVEGNWRYSSDNMEIFSSNKELYITQDLYIRRIVKSPRYKRLKDLLCRTGENEDLSYDADINPDDLTADGWGSNEDADEELRIIFGQQKPFNYPKPVKLITKLLYSYSKSDFIVLDSFAGSGTTAHAVLNMNKADSGHRHFILVEMMDYADSITAERVKRVIDGYGEGKNAVEGTGGDFTFYDLGPALLLPDGNLNENAGTEKIREYVWYMETKSPYAPPEQDNPYYLGAARDTGYYFYYEKDTVTTLNHQFLATITEKAENYLIYADLCAIPDEELKRYNITFKKIPRDITKL
ncbi:MAG: site-specific DNA-methyltransferase [Clostridia bacterium]|nr:site-specific DNA-methyltransferase [Clostridia bacterium]